MIGCSVSLFLGIVSSCGLWEIIKRMMEEMSGFFFSAVSSLKCLVVGFFFVLLWLVGLFWWPYMFQILRDCHMQGQDFDSVVLVAPF